MQNELVRLENGNWIRLIDVSAIWVNTSETKTVNEDIHFTPGIELVIIGPCDTYMNETITCSSDEEAHKLAESYAKRINQHSYSNYNGDVQVSGNTLIKNDCKESLSKTNEDSANIIILPSDKLPINADVKLYVHNNQRYVRWVSGDESDEQLPKILYQAPGWVWLLYSQGIARGADATDSKS